MGLKIYLKGVSAIAWGAIMQYSSVLGEDAIDLECGVCDLSEVFCLRDFSQSPPMMVGLPTKTSSSTTFHLDTSLYVCIHAVLALFKVVKVFDHYW